ncbi:hypothetical protein BYT27DRAFT_7264686 [Phlegmacium glaucopus]|nr:hypothetical protein BYT27DRAFT_7264686 [Phlegmacium glaucopus]
MTHNNPNSNSQSSRWFQPPPTYQQPLPLPQFFPPFVPGSQANGMPWGAQPFYGLPFWTGSMYQGLGQQGPPSSGPYHDQRGGGRPRTGPQQPNHNIHASSGMTRRGHSVSTHQGDAWMGAGNNPGTGGSSRLPSRNPSSANSYHRGPSRTRRQTEDVSVYEVPITDLSMGTGSAATGGPNTPAVTPMIPPSVLQPPTPASAMSTSTSTAVSNEDTETTSTEIQEGSVEDDDFHTISSGSDAE